MAPCFSSAVADLRGVSSTEDAVLVLRLCSALRAGVLSFASPKESSQRKGTPRVGAGRCPVPCATRPSGRLAKLACGSNRRKPKAPGQPALLSASQGDRKTSRNNGSALEITKKVFFGGRPLATGQNHFERFGGDAFPGPHVERRATELMADKGRGLSEGRSPEFRSPRQQRVAQGSRQRRPRSLGSPFLWLLSFGEAKESTPARKAEQSRKTSTTSSVAETPYKLGIPLSHKHQKATAC